MLLRNLVFLRRFERNGSAKAKLSFDKNCVVESNPVGKLILVTAINPTPAGEGIITIGLMDALNKIERKPWLLFAKPSLGPVMGIMRAAGGGYAQVLPMEDITFTLPGICMPLQLLTTLFCLWLTTTYTKETAGNRPTSCPLETCSRLEWLRCPLFVM